MSRSTTKTALRRRRSTRCARVDHPNVVRIFGSHDGQIYFTMQHVAGATLRSWVAGRAPGEPLAAYL